MAISWDSFDKIWASTSPLTPYSFSDPNYAQGWNFVGSTPPARQMWDSIQKQNDEKFKYLRDNFGTPNIVTQASQMTDTDKVYVYLGSEAGWNSGHWYYYDEGTSSWADGGVYNSVAFVTDTTLSIAGQPADAKATGDALALKSDLAGCTFTGNVGINADLSVTGDASIGTDLSVTGVSTLTGNVSAGADVTVVGDVSSANLTTSADATIGGDLSVTGTTSLTGNVTAGDVTANDVSVANINASNNGTIGGSLSVTGTSTLTGNVSAGADITAVGDVSADNLTTTTNATVGGSLSVAGASTLTGNVSAGADITVVGDISSANITASNNANIGGNATVTGSVTSASLTTTADGTIGGNLSVSGTTTLTGNVSASADLSVAGDSSLTNLSVSGTTALAGTSTAPTPSADDNSTKIATTEYVQTEIKPIEVNADIVNKRVTNIEKLLEGNLYDYQTDTDSKYTKSVPAGAMPYASLDSVGGKTLVFNQLVQDPNMTDVTKWSTDTIPANFSFSVSSNTLKVERLAGSNNFVLVSNPNTTKRTANHKFLYSFTLRGDVARSIRFYYGSGTDTINATTTFEHYSGICTPTTGGGDIGINVLASQMDVGGYIEVQNYCIFDLTLMYGAGNEPTTVAEFQQTFPASYYPYNAGTLLSAGVTEVKSVGVNLFDPNAITDNKYLSTTTGLVEPNNSYCVTDYIPVNAGQTIYIPDTYTARRWLYDVDKNPIEYLNNSNEQYYVPTRSGYIRVSINKISVDINGVIIAYSTTIPTYVPYNGHTYPIPAEIRNLEGYGWSAGSVYNYIDYERKKFVKCVDRIDLGTLTWTYQGTANAFYTTEINNIIVPATENLICPNYVFGSISSSVTLIASLPDKQVYRQPGNKNVFIKDSSYNGDANAFATAMSGVYLYYELATPVEVDISAYITDDNLIEVEAGGSLTFPNQHGDDYRIDVPSSETYMVDLQASL